MGRTKGSKNGVSTTPGYVAIGQKAQNDWQQQTATDAKDRQRETAQAYAQLILQRIQDQKAAKKDKRKASQAGGTNDWQRAANATAAGVSVER